VDNLLDGVNHTCDDLHAWLAPFTRGRDHLIYMDFDEVCAVKKSDDIGMIV
jgi:protein JBTS26